MANTFYINDFLRHINIDLLKSFYDSNSVPFSYSKKLNTEELINHVLDHFKSLSGDTQDVVITQLSQVNELSAYAGAELLKEAAKKGKVKLPEKFDDFSIKDTALWFYMNEDSLFNQTATKYELQDTVGWKDIFVPQISNAKVSRKRNVFTLALQKHLQDNESKGRYCIVEKYLKNGNIFFVAQPQDYARSDVTYSDATKINNKIIRKPIFKIFFRYDPKIGMLSVKSTAGRAKDKIKNYQKIFCKHVLNHEVNFEDQKIFDLNLIKDEHFSLPTKPEVEYVKIRSATLLYYDRSLKITLDLNQDSRSGLDDFHYRVKQLRIPLDFVNVVSAKFYFNFKKPASLSKGLRTTVTAQVSFPNSHNFADKTFHNKAREYLKEWGITKKHDEKIVAAYLEPPVSTGSDKDSNR